MKKLVEEIRLFLLDSAKNGYGNKNAQTVKEADGSNTIVYKNGNFKLHDNYFGGEPYGGREVIFKKGEPIWMMSYYGAVLESNINLQDVYGFLRKNLLNPDHDTPIRGPLDNKEENWHYKLYIKGNLKDFRCEEIITFDGGMVYKASFTGGLVDQRND